ncbi:hypothetical protein P43SY_006734 [Pythium insidiosum]|uniref:Uncharacterized protein n=1 Tax=Pythium insidiosum TaxID=114742 RepID=A0AAD5LSR2_PYTIN|nr:hypothetical protein P43SY_006734 [Pythium insidiosum]
MAWPEPTAISTGDDRDWQMELQLPLPTADEAHVSFASDPFFLPPPASALSSNGHNGASSATPASLARSTGPLPTGTAPSSGLTYSASCPSFTSLYDINGEDLLSEIPDGEPLGPDTGYFGAPFGAVGSNGFGMPAPTAAFHSHVADAALGGYDYVLQLQQQHQSASLRLHPHQQAQLSPEQFELIQQQVPRRPLHMSASFTSLSSMETEYRRRMASKRKKAATERWSKQQRHKSFDSTTTSVATTAPSPATSMEFAPMQLGGNHFDTMHEPGFHDGARLRSSGDPEMIGFSIDDFPTTFTTDATWPTPLPPPPPPLSLGDGSTFNDTNGSSSQEPSASPDASSADADLLLSDQERTTMSNLFDAIRDFDSTRFGCPLALSMEQASPAFRAEVKLRIEKRVTSAAGQDLLQHMQKKTRLRSLDDLRSEARMAVLGEMERELRLYMQSVNWASANGSDTATSTSDNQKPSKTAECTADPSSTVSTSGQGAVPAYLLSVAAAGFAAFYANQASLLSGIAAMSSPSPAKSVTSAQSTTPQPLSRQSSASTSSSSVSTPSQPATVMPLAPKTLEQASTLSPPRDALSPVDKAKDSPVSA